MSYFTAVLLCAFLAVTLGAPNVDKEKVKQSLGRLKAAHESCNEDVNANTYVDIEALKKSHKDGTPEPANAGHHAFCVTKKLGWQNEDGTVNEADLRRKIKEIVGDSTDQEGNISKALEPQSTPEQTAKHLLENFFKNVPRPSGSHAHKNEN